MKQLAFSAYIKEPASLKKLDREELDGMITAYPYFATARIFLAKQQLEKGTGGADLLGKAALYTFDRDRLKSWIEDMPLTLQQTGLRKTVPEEVEESVEVEPLADEAKESVEVEPTAEEPEEVEPLTEEAEEPDEAISVGLDEEQMAERRLRAESIRKEQARILGLAISLPVKIKEQSDFSRETEDEWQRSEFQLKHNPTIVSDLLEAQEAAESVEVADPMEAQEAAESVEVADPMEATEQTDPAEPIEQHEEPNDGDKGLGLEPSASVSPVTEGEEVSNIQKGVSDEAKFDLEGSYDFTTWLRNFSQDSAQAGAVANTEDSTSESAPEIPARFDQSKATPMKPDVPDLGRFGELIQNQRKLAQAKHSEIGKKKEEIADWVVSETYALLLEKQGRVDRAIAVYEKLSLLYPEKSSFFASRIKALQAEI